MNTILPVFAQAKLNHNVDCFVFNKDVVYSPEIYATAKVFSNSALANCCSYLLDSALVYKSSQRNKVVDDGCIQIISLMIGADSRSITYSGVGSGTTTPASGDHDLTTAIGSRHTISYRYRVGSYEAHFDTFFGDTENNGTWNEAGLFTGTASYPTDYMIAHLLVNQPGGYTKDATKTAVLAWTITLSPT